MKRGQSGLSLLVAVNKPSGMSSHDVVNRCRRIFGERRVGHTGTLDPLATGVLPICVGPATRLDKYLTGHDKRYRVRIAFGCETTTDDSAGEPTVIGEASPPLFDESYARSFVKSLIGEHEQLPPAYSAIKVNGKKAYEIARGGNEVKLDFRTIRILDARMHGIFFDGETGQLVWDAEFEVSKGTYIRSLARDIGRIVGTPAHVSSLERLASGCITAEQAVSLQTLESLGVDAAIDPVAALGLRFAFGDDCERFVSSGNALRVDQLNLNEQLAPGGRQDHCACMGKTVASSRPAENGELVSVVVKNRLQSLYRFDAKRLQWRSECVFATPVFRG